MKGITVEYPSSCDTDIILQEIIFFQAKNKEKFQIYKAQKHEIDMWNSCPLYIINYYVY